MDCSVPGFPSFTISQRLLKLMSIESVMPSNRLILCCPLLLLPSIFPSISVFPMSWLFLSGGQSIGASASSISPSNEYSGLISFRIDWFDLLATAFCLNTFRQFGCYRILQSGPGLISLPGMSLSFRTRSRESGWGSFAYLHWLEWWPLPSASWSIKNRARQHLLLPSRGGFW